MRRNEVNPRDGQILCSCCAQLIRRKKTTIRKLLFLKEQVVFSETFTFVVYRSLFIHETLSKHYNTKYEGALETRDTFMMENLTS